MVRTYFGAERQPKGRMHEVLVRAALMCRAETCVILIQDLLGLGHEARINDPARLPGNWHWRLKKEYLTRELQEQIYELTRRYGRLNWDADSVQQRQRV